MGTIGWGVHARRTPARGSERMRRGGERTCFVLRHDRRTRWAGHSRHSVGRSGNRGFHSRQMSSATRKQPSRANKGGGASAAVVRASLVSERGEGGEQQQQQQQQQQPRHHHHRKGRDNSPQATALQQQQQQQQGQQTQTTQGQRARRRPSRSTTTTTTSQISNNTKSKSTAPPPPSAVSLPPTNPLDHTSPSPLPSSTTTPSTTTVKRTLDVAPPTVGPKGIMHDKMVHVSFHSVPDHPPTSATPSNRATRAQKREERLQQRSSHSMDIDTDSDSSSPRVEGLFDNPLLPPRKPRKKPKQSSASTKNAPDPTTSSTDPTGSTPNPNPPTPHAAPTTPFASFPPQAQGWSHVGSINVTPTGWTNPANAPESSAAPGRNGSYQPFARLNQPSPSLHDTSPTLVHQTTPQLLSQAQPDSDGFVDPGPWYPWKADTTWYERHPTIPYYRLHEKWFPGAPTLATHPEGQNGGVIYDDGKTYPPSMFVEGRQDLEFFGMGIDPPDTLYDFVGTVNTARHFHFDDSRAGFDRAAKDELDAVGRPLPFITVYEDEMVALVEEFLWRRRRARYLGKPVPNLDPPLERRLTHTASPTAAPKPVNLGLSTAVSAWNTEPEAGGEGGEQGYSEGRGSASSAPVPGQSKCQLPLL
jgi:hypothetical protein